MPLFDSARIGYVLKMYPRFSETFILTEILAHEQTGANIDVFSLRTPTDGKFHEAVSRVRAPVSYLPYSGLRVADFWKTIRAASAEFPSLWNELELATDISPAQTLQAIDIARATRLRNIDHLHAHFATSPTTVARLAARLADVTYSFTAHAKDIFIDSVDDDVLRAKLRDAAFVVTVSEFNIADLRRRYGSDAAGVRRIYNGLDLNEFAFDSSQRSDSHILAVGRLVEKKGLAHLIKACDELRRRGRSFSCEIVGAGPLEENLRRQISETNLTDAISLTGPLPRHDVMARLRRATVLAAPCVTASDGNRDGLPTVLLEAMAIGTPCVSTTVTGIPEAVRHNETGLLAPPGDSEALADQLERILNDAALRDRLATNARALIEREFDIHQTTAAMRTQFKNAIETSTLTPAEVA